MKGLIKENHIPLNNYRLMVLGLGFTITELSGIEEEIQVVDLPDRTKASGGTRPPIEFTINTPMHHLTEQVLLESWYKEAQDPVLSSYKKVGTLLMFSNTGDIRRSFTLTGLFIFKRTLPDMSMENEGEMAGVEWTLSADDIIPL